jgi:tetratricopeptide (TPR) repeat protein
MKYWFPLVAVTTSLVAACANPINRATSDNYAETCAVAESNGRLDVAEEACYRALVNVDWGNLGPELKSQALYNLGRIKRRLSKFGEAEQLFKESLALEEKLPTPSEQKIGRRLVELSVSLAGQDKWSEGARYLERVLPLTEKFSPRERAYTSEVLSQYGKRLAGTGDSALAARFEAKASTLK